MLSLYITKKNHKNDPSTHICQSCEVLLISLNYILPFVMNVSIILVENVDPQKFHMCK